MTKLRLLRLALVTLLMGAIATVLSVGWAQEDQQPVFRVGVLDDIRGSLSNGARLAVRDINQAGGVRGADGTQFRLELVIQPTAEGDDLQQAIENIDQARVIAVIGPRTTEQVLSNLPLLQSLGVPILTPAIGDTVIASDSTGVLFRIRAAERLQGTALAQYLVGEIGFEDVTTVQLDRNSTASRVGFSVALSQLEDPPQETTLLLDSEANFNQLVTDILAENPPVAVVYGPPELALRLYRQLREANWVGVFAYNDAANPVFSDTLTPEDLRGVISTTTWSLAALDTSSNIFLNEYVRAFNEAPDPIAASAFDAVTLLAEAIGQPGDLRSNLTVVRDIQGVQGVINPSGLIAGETSDTVAVIQMNALGGFDVVARYEATRRLPVEVVEATELPPDEPTPTPTPDGVFLTIESQVQNVRTGPSLNYDVLGQLRQGETAPIIGATADFSWVVIDFRGEEGWLATYLLEVTGDRTQVPVFQAPPTPTPPPATATPTAPPLPDIVVVAAAPSNISLGLTTNVNVTVRNAGTVDAGPFAVAATFAPDSLFAAANIQGLAAGTEVITQLPVLLNTTTGSFQTVIIADLNNQISEGQVGEANNDDFIFTYQVDRQLILINNATRVVGEAIDLEANVTPINDIQFTDQGLATTGNCTGTTHCIGLLSPTLTWDTATFDAISPDNGINQTFIPNNQLSVGMVIGVLTGEGRRGVIRVDAITPNVSITFTYRIYQNP